MSVVPGLAGPFQSDPFAGTTISASRWQLPPWVSGNGVLTQNNGLFYHTNGNGTADDEVDLVSTGVGPVASDWSVWFDARVPNLASIAVDGQSVTLTLKIWNTSNEANRFDIETFLTQAPAPYGRVRTLGADLTTDDWSTDVSNGVFLDSATQTLISMGASWQASTKTFSAWYAPAGGGSNWIRLGSWNLGPGSPTEWNLEPAGGFGLYIGGGSGSVNLQAADNVRITSFTATGSLLSGRIPPTITTGINPSKGDFIPLPAATLNGPYDQTIGATGGALPHTWSLIVGSLPSGLELDAGTGTIHGIPTAAGTSNFRARVTGADGAYAEGSYSITVNGPTPPDAITGPATEITTTTATLNGTVNPNGLATTAQFEYGLTTAYGSTAGVALSPDNGSTAQNASAAISGLIPGQTYHFRLRAANAGGTTLGADMTFATPALPPAVTTSPATGVTASCATLHGTVNPSGMATTAQFEYGLTTAYGSTANATLSPDNGTTAQNVSAAISGLQTNQTYHFRLKARNATTDPNWVFGGDMIFVTPPLQFTYTITNGQVTITGYTGSGGVAAIPDMIDGLPVTKIGTSAFKDQTGLTSVIIPNGVTSIGSYAFQSCTSLTSVTIPGSVTSIGSYAFSICTSLTSAIIPSGVTSIEGGTFGNCTSLTGVTIPNGVIGIGNSAFAQCGSLTSLAIPGSLTNIGMDSFYGCGSLASFTVDPLNPTYSSANGVLFNKSQARLIQYPGGKVGSYTIPGSVTSIGFRAFNYSPLTSVTIHANVNIIEDQAFVPCTSLTSITVDVANPNFSSLDGVLFNKARTTLIQYPGAKAGAYLIPPGVTSIGSHAFASCTGLTSVTLPASVTSIGRGAFALCTGLTSITLPNSVTSIETYAFSYCWGLNSALFTGNAPAVGTTVFYNTASGFTVYYVSGAAGFTSPTWQGYSSVALPNAPEIVVEQPAGTNLTTGGSLDFGPVAVGGTPVVKICTIRNRSGQNLTGLAISVIGTHAADFTVSQPTATTLAPLASATFTVSLAPTASGLRQATLRIASNDADENPFVLVLSGSGVLPSIVTTGSATDITATTATLNGTVNPNGLATTAQFEYGLTTAYGSTTTATLSPNNGTTAQNVSAAISGLTSDQTYHFRLTGTNSGGTSPGGDRTFTTLPAIPPAVTLSATNVTGTAATLNGTVNPNGLATTAQFEYGLTTAYGSTVSVTLSPNNGTTAQNVSAAISGLTSGQTYHLRLKATNSAGTTLGGDLTFSTSPAVPPAVTTGNATEAVGTFAFLHGTVNPNGFTTTVQFEYGLTTAYGNNASAWLAPNNGLTPRDVVAELTDLLEGQTYHYRITATNIGGTASGADMTFSTSPSSPPTVAYLWATGDPATGSLVVYVLVNKNGLPTNLDLEFGPTDSYGYRFGTAVWGPVLGGNYTVTLWMPLAWREVHYRLTATNAAGTTVGADMMFEIPLDFMIPPISPGELAAPKIAVTGAKMQFTIQSAPAGRRYQLQQSDTMEDGSWMNVGPVYLGGNDVFGWGSQDLVIPGLYDPPVAFDPAAPRRFYRVLLDPEGFELIPAGEFQMGDQSDPPVGGELPVHPVQVSAFYMGKFEVTKAVWDEVRNWGLANGYNDLAAGDAKASNHPVQSVTWFDIVKWCNARSQKEGLTPCYTVGGAIYQTGNSEPDCDWSANGYRLPTEAEWEKAARGGLVGQSFPWGGETISHDQANYSVSSDGTTNEYWYDVGETPWYHPVFWTGQEPYTSPGKSFAANGYRLYDIAGNVWEWCWDWYGDYAAGLQTDPHGEPSGTYRVFRGGGWDDYRGAEGCRVASRWLAGPDFSFNSLGFRLARSSGL